MKAKIPGPIRTSIFDLFNIGPGPSSSHTIGPMRAGYDFIGTIRTLDSKILKNAENLTVNLFGSLSATGRGHGTDKAILAGLLGKTPEECSHEFLNEILKTEGQRHLLDLGPAKLAVTGKDIIFDAVEHSCPYHNKLVITLSGPDGQIFQREYHSVGGGFIQWEGQPVPDFVDLPYSYETMEQLKFILHEQGIRLHQLILENECALTGGSEKDVMSGLDRIIDTMEKSVERGLKAEGVLPGSLKLQRKARVLFKRANEVPEGTDRFLLFLNAYAFAASEENAAGHVVVTAPTSGASGVIPAVLHAMRHHLKIKRESMREGLLAAAAIGFLVKHNASIAGADVGCQGEVGTASAMAAAMLAYGTGSRFWVTENAAETALEHHLGLTCDPVGGYVQIPCIERNAMGAVKAYNAYLIATVEDPKHHVVGLDSAIKAMNDTGRDMSCKYKETSMGGLAASMTEC